MAAGTQIDRRRDKAQGYRLERSAFVQIPAKVAVPALGFAVLLTALAHYLSPPYVWFGPVNLLVIAFAAWSVNSRVAIALGLLVISVNLLTGNASVYPYGQHLLVLNFALRLLCVLAVVLVLGLARRSLEKEWLLARIDPLTGALNRQAFFGAVEADYGHAGCNLLIFVDLDGLKRLNDEMGHELGDKGLRDFADRVRSAIRKNDLFARIGGDEFVILMKVRDQAAAEGVVKRLDETLNPDAHQDATTLKCSLGALLLPAGSKSIDAELRAADKLMYTAKRAHAGFMMALAIEADGKITLSPLLLTAPPTGRETAVRSKDRRPDREATPSDSLPVKTLAA